MFAHEKLQLYAKALDFCANAAELSAGWDKKHAVVDQFRRAAESIPLNLAEAVRQHAAPGRLTIIDYAIGSSLECAACLDIARIKEFLDDLVSSQAKQRLCEITKMLIGLRKAWQELLVVHEDPLPYDHHSLTPAPFFHHERLRVYQTALDFMEWLVLRPGAKELSNRLLRQVDEAASAVILHIAEGNGRYADLDHRRFLRMADTAAVKAAVCLDLCAQKGLLTTPEIQLGKDHLWQVSAMLGKM